MVNTVTVNVSSVQTKSYWSTKCPSIVTEFVFDLLAIILARVTCLVSGAFV